MCFSAQSSSAAAVLAQYGDVSGADNRYGYFAPAVGSRCRVALTLRDAAGREWGDALVDDPSTAFGWRAHDAIDSIATFPDSLRRGVTASWAAVMFGRHPGAAEVDVAVEMEDLPTMAQWRQGARSNWTPIYRGTFVRRTGSR